MTMKTLLATASVLGMCVLPAFAHATSTGGSNDSNASSASSAAATANAGATANAASISSAIANPSASATSNPTQVTKVLNEQSLKQGQSQTNGNNDINVNNDNSSDDKNYFSPSLGGIPLASGSNNEMAPNSYSFGATSLFGGLLFGWSTQQLAPSAIVTLADLGEKASRQYQETASENDKVMGKHIENALCTYYHEFAERENLCQ